MLKKTLLLAAASILLVACSNTIESMKDTITTVLVPKPDVDLTLAELKQYRQPLLYLRPNDRGRTGLLLQSSQGSTTRWLSSDARIVQLQSGRIQRLQNFKPNLDASSFSTPDPITLPLNKIRAGMTTTSINDWADTQLNSYVVSHEIIDKQASSLTFFAKQLPVVLVKERVQFPDGSSFINQFWFAQPSGDLVQSIQKPAPFALEFEMIEISKVADLLANEGDAAVPAMPVVQP